MISPRGFFPQTFGKYLHEIDEIFEQDWPSTFMEKQLEEFKGTLTKAEETMGIKKSDKMKTFVRSSPRYEVIDGADKFEVKVDVPGFKPNEIEVELRAGGRLLTITGNHEEKEETREFSSKFQQNFSMDPSILTDELHADFQDDTLVISAPRKVERLPETRDIPIKMIEHSKKSGKDKKKGDKEKLKP